MEHVMKTSTATAAASSPSGCLGWLFPGRKPVPMDRRLYAGPKLIIDLGRNRVLVWGPGHG